MQREKLQQRFAMCSHVSFVLYGDTIGIVVDNVAAHAEILLRGAHLLSYVPQGHRSVLWNSTASTYDKSSTLHGGMPLVAPWFGDPARNINPVQRYITEDGMQRTHGFVRDALWDIVEIEMLSDTKTRVTMIYDYEPTAQALWQQPFQTQVIFTIGTELRVDFTIYNRSNVACTYASALHTYFALSDVAHVSIPSCDGVTYIDTRDAWQKKMWKGVLKINQEHDDIFLDPPQRQRIVDDGWGRDLEITAHGSASMVVWNPWEEKAKTLEGFLPADYRTMVCIETGQLFTDARTVAAGKVSSFGVTIASQKHKI